MSPKGGVGKKIAEAQAPRDAIEGQSISSSHRSGGIRRRTADSGAGSDTKNPLIDTLTLKWGKVQNFRQRRGRNHRWRHSARSQPVAIIIVSSASAELPTVSQSRTEVSWWARILPHLARGFIHCCVLMIDSDRCSVRDRAGGKLRSEATLEQPSGTGMDSKSRTRCETIWDC